MTIYHMKRSLYDRFVSRRTGEVHLDRISNDEDLGLFSTKEAAVKRIAELSPNIELRDNILEPTSSGSDINCFWWAVYSIPNGVSNGVSNMEWQYEIREREVFE